MSKKISTSYFFLFHGIHEVLKAENVLKSHGVAFELVPVPRALSSECGVCIMMSHPSNNVLPLLFALNLDRCFFFDGKEYCPVSEEYLTGLSKQA